MNEDEDIWIRFAEASITGDTSRKVYCTYHALFADEMLRLFKLRFRKDETKS